MQKTAKELPVYEVPTEKSGTAVEKHYYMVLTLADEGVLACEALRSGTTEGKLENPEAIEYWFDHLVKLGLGTAEQEEAFRQHTWQVRALQKYVTGASACGVVRRRPAPVKLATRLLHEWRAHNTSPLQCTLSLLV